MERATSLVVGDVDDLAPEDVRRLVAEAVAASGPLRGGTIAGVFEHPSMRTRSALGVAAAALGATPVFFTGDEIGIDTREAAEDVAEVLARHHRVVGARLRRHATFERMAPKFAGHQRPFVNLLTDRAHPTQAIADVITIHEALGTLEGVRIAWIGDANNVARSLAKAAGALGAEVRIAAPAGFQFTEADVAEIDAYLERAGRARGAIALFDSPTSAARGADVLSTDVWVSMGEDPAKRGAFEGWALTEALVAEASDEVGILHCLPAHRGEEIEASVLDGPHSWAFRQAGHRVTAMVRLLALLVDRAGSGSTERW